MSAGSVPSLAPPRATQDPRVAAVLAERARALARPAPLDETAGRVSLVLFEIGGVQHALEAVFVREVVRRPLLSIIRSAPASLIGVANVRGEILAVADISALLGVAAPPERGPVIVLAGDGPPVGLLVQAVHDVVDVETDSIVPLPENGAPGGPPSESLLMGVTARAAVLSAGTLLNDPRLSTTEPGSGR